MQCFTKYERQYNLVGLAHESLKSKGEVQGSENEYSPDLSWEAGRLLMEKLRSGVADLYNMGN